MMPFVTALAGACFLISSFYLIRDRAAVTAIVTGHSDENRTLLNHGDYDDNSTTDDISNDVNCDVTNNDVINDDIASDDVQADDVKVDDIIDSISNDVNCDVTNNDVINDDIASDDVQADDVKVDDIIDRNGLVQPVVHSVQHNTSGDSVSDNMETTQNLLKV